MGNWPADPGSELAEWSAQGIDRVYVNVGAPDMLDRVRQLAALAASAVQLS